MPSVNRVSNVEFDGSCSVITFGIHEIPYLSASYGDALEVERVPQAGQQGTAALTLGRYKADDVSIKFRSSVFRSLLVPRLPSAGFGNVGIDLVVNFIHPGIGDDSDLLRYVQIVNLSTAIEA